eukprot:CAMPEP_0197190694 /NCGR_PEP_ID=MMETSP1423-20130617/22166_1 /TAXON_ID=476441 /ORGANISM="Pseudo-nitzschia heimii, Strain UNC1101" /LENGTH=93 /DNA_ID=CAMNT_0042643141 /DNA_START=96 /DNA_END=373 /DNA_ORIENTATION=-
MARSSTDRWTIRPDALRSGVLVLWTSISSSANVPRTAFVVASRTVQSLGYDRIRYPAICELYVSGLRKYAIVASPGTLRGSFANAFTRTAALT